MRVGKITPLQNGALQRLITAYGDNLYLRHVKPELRKAIEKELREKGISIDDTQLTRGYPFGTKPHLKSTWRALANMGAIRLTEVDGEMFVMPL